jgi:sugar phosphate isomerase/epimerase
MEMEHLFKYGVACSLNDVSATAPIILRGDIETVCAKAKEIGYDGLEIQLCDPQNYEWKEIKQTTDYYGLEIVAFATGRELIENKLSLISNDSSIRRAAIDKLKLHIDMAKKVGSMVIVGSMRSHIPDFSKREFYENLHREAILEVSDYAKLNDVKIVVENITTHISNYLNTMKEVADFVRDLKRDNVGIHLDTYSMLMEDNDIWNSIRYCGKDLKYIHFSDSGRLYPGGGNVDFKSFMKALIEIGYSGWISTECIPYPNAYACAKNGYDYISALETIVRIENGASRLR